MYLRMYLDDGFWWVNACMFSYLKHRAILMLRLNDSEKHFISQISKIFIIDSYVY